MKDFKRTVDEFKKELLLEFLEAADYQPGETAKLARLNRTHLFRMMHRYKIDYRALYFKKHGVELVFRRDLTGKWDRPLPTGNEAKFSKRKPSHNVRP